MYDFPALPGASAIFAITVGLSLLGMYGAPYEAEKNFEGRNEARVGPDYAFGPMAEHLYLRAATIYGGSNEIQRNIISKMVLGL